MRIHQFFDTILQEDCHKSKYSVSTKIRGKTTDDAFKSQNLFHTQIQLYEKMSMYMNDLLRLMSNTHACRKLFQEHPEKGKQNALQRDAYRLKINKL